MKNNLALICYDNALSRRIANALSEQYDMRYFDMYDMFGFDNAPYSFAEVLKMNGEDYVDKKMRSILKSEFSFSNAILIADIKVLYKNQDLFEKFSENNLVLFLKGDFKTEFAQREHAFFRSEEEKEYFSLPIDILAETEQKIEQNLADIKINIDDLNYNQIKDKIVEILKNL